jgi:hypothetical protein
MDCGFENVLWSYSMYTRKRVTAEHIIAGSLLLNDNDQLLW